MILRRFNAAGIAVFQAFLDSCTAAESLPWPGSALTDPKYSEPVQQHVELAEQSFSSRFELAEYLYAQFESAGFAVTGTVREVWSWIACRYFRQVCGKLRGTARWAPGHPARWIPQTADYRRYYRHLFAGPFGIYRAHRDDPSRALVLLCQPVNSPGEVVEQIASRQELVTNPAIVQVATNCFVEPSTGRPRRGASTRGAGGAERFVKVLQQFDVTWDLSAISAAKLQSLLPEEFRRNS